MATFISVVSDVLRQNGILSGNDSDVTAFTDTQHQASIQLAITSVQSVLNQLTSETLIPYERADGTITFASGTRTYALPSDFVRFANAKPFMLQLDSNDNSDGRLLYEYPGGVEALSNTILDYREQSGTPINWYMTGGSTEQVGFWQVPDTTVDTLKVRFEYEKEVMVTVAADTLPFTIASQDIAFTDMASRYFFILRQNVPISSVYQDAAFNTSKATLARLIESKNPNKKYGHSYR